VDQNQVTVPGFGEPRYPTKADARNFALMIQTGFPSKDAIRYFFPDVDDPAFLVRAHNKWIKASVVQGAIKELQGGKEWQDLSLEEQIDLSIKKHYSELAYFLYSTNYASLTSPAERQKADTCRQALEAKIAGTSGKLDPAMQWLDDVRRGKIKLGGAGASIPAPQTGH
jgi:hypothetical protein